jgi:PilZ domain-containing protein
MEGLGVNISDVGMCLFTLANLPLGSQIQVEFLPPQCTSRMRVCATVRHRAVYLYGIEFRTDSDQSPADRADGQERQESTFLLTH